MPQRLTDVRTRWAAAQDLLAPEPAPDGPAASAHLAGLVARTGWLRTLGGAEAYLALRARAPGVRIEQVQDAVGEGALCVVPAVRGCIYLVPRQDVPLALAVSQALDGRRFDREREKAGIEDGELERVGEAAVEVLAGGRLTTRALGGALPDGLVRSLGDAGKKVGLSSTLPPALRLLEWAGRIRRVPVDGRLDHERYTWVVRTEPLPDPPPDPFVALARRYLAWAGPAPVDDFIGWAGLGKRDGRAAIAALDPVEVAVEGHDDPLVALSDDPAPEPTGRLVGVPGLDNLHHLRAGTAPIVDPEHHGREVARFGSGTASLGNGTNVYDRLLVRDGEVVGGLAWDPAEARMEAHAWGAPADQVQAECEDLTTFLRELGHGRAFSLDKDKTLARRRDRMRAWGV